MPDLRARRLADLAAKGRGQQLVTQAHAHVGKAAADHLADRLLLGRQPGMPIPLPHIHRPAHDPQSVVTVERRNRIPRVEFDGVPGDAVGGEEIAEDAGMLDGDVLENEKSHAPHSAGCGNGAGRRSPGSSSADSATIPAHAASRMNRGAVAPARS